MTQRAESTGITNRMPRGTTTPITPLTRRVTGQRKKREVSNTQIPDFQAILKTIDDDIGYKSPMIPVIELKSNYESDQTDGNVPIKCASKVTNQSNQTKPNPEAHDTKLLDPKSGSVEDIKPNCILVTQGNVQAPNRDPKGSQTTWKRIIRSPSLVNNEVIIHDPTSRKELHATENTRPTKCQALDNNEVCHHSPMVVAIE